MRKILFTLISFVGLSALIACGGGSFKTQIPPSPSTGNNAGFSNSSLKGTYVFSANGVSPNNSYAVVGAFTADGAGNISSGTRDTVNDGGGQALSEAITGSYSVNQDGRGQAVLNGNSGQVIYRFAMQSAASAKLFQISNTSDATGKIELQSAVNSNVLQAIRTYIARFDGEDTGRNPYGAVGGLTIAGTAITGTIDENDAGAFSPQLAATGSDTSPDVNGRGTLTFTLSSGTHNFIYYWVSPSRIELVSTDKNFFIFGHTDLQTSIAGTAAAFVGDQVINIAGFTSNGNIVETGRLTLDGAGNLTNAIEDYNEAGVFFPSVTFTGSYAVAADGRWTANLIYSTSTVSMVGWQVSGSQSSTVLITGSSIANFSIEETGTLSAQTTNLTTTNVSGNYAEDLSGFFVGSGNVESTGNFLADGAGNLNGTIDSQTPFAENTDIAQTGLYSVLANGRAAGSIGAVPVVLYTRDANTIYLISSDPNRIYQGKMEKQP
jgi:hypothetical protein